MNLNYFKLFSTLSIILAYIALTILNFSTTPTAKMVATGFFVGAIVSIIIAVVWTLRQSLNQYDKKLQKKDSVQESIKASLTNHKITIMKNSFVAIDFEHLYPSHETACEVGAVRVVGGMITGRFHSTIKPPHVLCQGRENSDIIGMNEGMLQKSPSFVEVYRMLCDFVGDLPLVAHHTTTERCVLEKCCAYYGISESLLKNGLEDTCGMAGGLGLEESCKKFGIPMMEHHNPLHDAEMTAKLYLALIGEKEVHVVRGERLSKRMMGKYQEERDNFDSTILKPLDDDEVENKDTPFFGKVKTVVSGQFEAYPDRNALKASLKSLGADIDGAISKNTKLFVVGKTGVGPVKMKKALEFGTRIIQEEELYQWVEKQI